MDNRGPQVEGIAWAFVVISTIATALRVYCRGVLLKSFLLDDYLAVIGWVSYHPSRVLPYLWEKGGREVKGNAAFPGPFPPGDTAHGRKAC